jgi:hypothetical protein
MRSAQVALRRTRRWSSASRPIAQARDSSHESQRRRERRCGAVTDATQATHQHIHWLPQMLVDAQLHAL